MKHACHQKIVRLDRLAQVAQDHRAAGRSTVLCHGCFDLVHPGHIRYLQWAGQQADVLVVSLTGDDGIEKQDGTRPHVPQELRAESLAALEFVDHVVVVDDPTAEPVIERLSPDLYVKGKEYEHASPPTHTPHPHPHAGFQREKALVEAAGGRVIFSSGDVVFSSTQMLDALADQGLGPGQKNTERLAACCGRWGLDHAWMHRTLAHGFSGKRVAIVGDSVCDRYVFCEQADVAAEAPVLSVRPVQEKSYLGAAAIVAAHIQALGATPHLITTTADPARDTPSQQLLDTLDRTGIPTTWWPTHRALPLKRRYLAGGQKLLKVDHADTRPMDSATTTQAVATLTRLAPELDAVIFTDFGYGTLTPALLEAALPLLRPHVSVIAGDVSGPQRTLLAYHGADLLTPTERELRGVTGERDTSLPTVAAGVMSQLSAPNMIVTMGAKGVVLFHPRTADPATWFTTRLRSDHVPALAPHAVDAVGAGDALLATATLARCAGCTLPQAAYLGSAAAAVAVSRPGNLPVGTTELTRWAATRPELQANASFNAA